MNMETNEVVYKITNNSFGEHLSTTFYLTH